MTLSERFLGLASLKVTDLGLFWCGSILLFLNLLLLDRGQTLANAFAEHTTAAPTTWS